MATTTHDPSPTESPPAFMQMMTGAELMAKDLNPRFLVRNVLADGQPAIIGARSKTLKTSLAIDLAISLGSGTPFLGKFDSSKVGVGFWSGESGAATIRETALRIAESKGVDLADCDVRWCFDLPKLSRPDHLESLAAVIRGEGLKVAVIDPLYLALLSPETASGASNLFCMGPTLQGLTRIGQETQATILVVHHFRKSGQPDNDNPCGLEELSQAGLAEWARQWILLQRQSPYQGDGRHSLWLRCGGSAGHSSLWGVTVEEGTIDPDTFTGRKWDVSLHPASEVRESGREARHRAQEAARQAKRESDLEADRMAIVTAFVKRKAPETKSGIRDQFPNGHKRFDLAFAALTADGTLAPATIQKSNGQTYQGWGLSNDQ